MPISLQYRCNGRYITNGRNIHRFVDMNDAMTYIRGTGRSEEDFNIAEMKVGKPGTIDIQRLTELCKMQRMRADDNRHASRRLTI